MPSITQALKSNGVTFELCHDNTDFTLNPTNGTKQSVSITRDFGAFDSSSPWTRWDAEYSRYFSLAAENTFSQQQVIAFNAWITDTPSRQSSIENNGSVGTYQRPPYYKDPLLGGTDRMRAYHNNRFNYKDAIYYGLGYRITPQWNPLAKISFAGIPQIDWWQWVLFTEAGSSPSQKKAGHFKP